MTKKRRELLTVIWDDGNAACTPIILLWLMYVEFEGLCEQMTGYGWYPVLTLATFLWTVFVCCRRLRFLLAQRKR